MGIAVLGILAGKERIWNQYRF